MKSRLMHPPLAAARRHVPPVVTESVTEASGNIMAVILPEARAGLSAIGTAAQVHSRVIAVLFSLSHLFPHFPI